MLTPLLDAADSRLETSLTSVRGQTSGHESAPHPGQSLWGRPVRQRRTPVNVGNQPHRDNGEGLAFGLPLTHFWLQKLVRGPGFRYRSTLGYVSFAPGGG